MKLTKRVCKSSNFWIGREVEGRFKGLRTLFVKGNQNTDQIKNLIAQESPNMLYFGAGNQSKVTDFNVIRNFLEKLPVTLEISEKRLKTLPENIIKHKNLHLVITFKNKYLTKLKPTDSIKVEDNSSVYVSTLECMYKTNKKTDYKEDKEI